MKRLVGCCLFVLAWLGIASTAMAISIGFTTSYPSVTLGDSLDVDVTISGLFEAGEIVSAYDLDVRYDAAILTATGVTFGPYLDDSLNPSFQDVILIGGLIDLAELSWLSDAELADQQPDSFVLATLHFDTLALGVSALEFVPDLQYGIDVKGRNLDGDFDVEILKLDVSALSVTVADAALPVPEPATLLLLGTGLLLNGVIVRRRRARK